MQLRSISMLDSDDNEAGLAVGRHSKMSKVSNGDCFKKTRL